MRFSNRVALLAGSAIACSIPFAAADANPLPPTSGTVSDVLLFQDYTGSTLYSCNEGAAGCEFLVTDIQTTTSGGIYFTEPGTGAISDYVYGCNGRIIFSSDDEVGISTPACIGASGAPLALSFANAGPETGDYIDITSDFAGLCLHPLPGTGPTCTGLGAEGAVVKFASDVSDTVGVPEPASWAVMLAGLTGLFGFCMRKRAAGQSGTR